jgi:hypothetical protein
VAELIERQPCWNKATADIDGDYRSTADTTQPRREISKAVDGKWVHDDVVLANDGFDRNVDEAAEKDSD